MRDHVAVKVWSERIDEEHGAAVGGVVDGTRRSWRHPIAARSHEEPGPAVTSSVAHYLQCRCGQVFVSPSSGTTRSLLRAHLAQSLAEADARSGFDAAAARRDGENHGGLTIGV
jgi:hypothetical protein